MHFPSRTGYNPLLIDLGCFGFGGCACHGLRPETRDLLCDQVAGKPIALKAFENVEERVVTRFAATSPINAETRRSAESAAARLRFMRIPMTHFRRFRINIAQSGIARCLGGRWIRLDCIQLRNRRCRERAIEGNRNN